MFAWLPRFVARAPATVLTKLIVAFLVIVGLLIILGTVGLRTLSEVNQRADELVRLQRNIAAYQQLQHDSTSQLYSIASALLVPDERTLETTLRQLNQFAYDVDRLHVVTPDDAELIGRVRKDYERFLDIVTKVVKLIRQGQVAEGRELQLTEASPLADRIERRMNELVNRAQTDILASVDASRAAYSAARRLVVGFALASIALALLLGFVISSSVIGPVKQIDTHLKEIAAGDFLKRITVENRDEFGALAGNLNRMSAKLDILYQQIETRNRELSAALDQQTATTEILRVISSSPTDTTPVFETIVANAARLCEANFAVALLYDGERLRAGAHTSISAEFAEYFARGFPVNRQTTAGRAALERKPVQVIDILAEPEFLVTAAHRSEDVRTVLAAPMLREDTLVGAIAIWRREVRPFTEQQTKLLQTFAAQAVIAIDNVRLFQELQARTRDLARSLEQLKALGEVGRTVSSTLDLNTVLTTIVSYAVQLSGTDAGSIYEYKNDALRLRATLKLEDVFVEALRASPVEIGEGAVGRAAKTQKPVEIPDILEEAAYPERLKHTMSDSGFRAVLAVPLLHEDRILGALAVLRKRPGAFPAETMELVTNFATQSALAIENARLFREIEDKSRQVEAASRHKSEFLANMSHELRTPLNAIIGFSEVLNEQMFGRLNEKQLEYVQDIHSSGRHLHALINDILDLSKIEAGRMELEIAPFDLPTAISDAATLVRERANRHGIDLGVSVDKRLGVFDGDERKVKQILLNLLSNALKFTPPGGRISVTAAPTNPGAEISVADTGIGIAAADHEIIFEEFRQAHNTGVREGTGLGLTLTRKFVEMHGGTIRVNSEPGKGATFTFTLPVRS